MESFLKTAKQSDAHLFKQVKGFCNMLTHAYLAAGIITGIAINLSPFILNFVNCYFFGADYNYAMPYKSDWPYDTSSEPAYEITYAMFIVATTVSILINVSEVRTFLVLY